MKLGSSHEEQGKMAMLSRRKFVDALA